MDYQTLVFLMLSFVGASIMIFISSLLNQTPKSTKLPPGPLPFPIIGNILELGRYPHKALTKLSKIYGPVMTLKLGSMTTIVISSPQVAKQVLHDNSQALSSRTVPHAIQALDHHTCSVAWLPPSTQWRTLRKVCVTKVFSPQQLDSMQILRQQKVQELLDFVKEKCMKGEVLDIGEAAFTTTLNSISNTLFSMDLAHFTSNEKFQEFKDIVGGVMEEAARPNVADFFPILRSLDPQRVHAKMSSYFKRLIEIFDGIIEERVHSRVSKTDSKACNDVLDSCLNIIEETGSQMNRHEMLHLFLVSTILNS